MKWMISLIITDHEKLETRVENVLLFIFNSISSHTCKISDIDATGYIGNLLTQKINQGQEIVYNDEDILRLVREDGQLFELDVVIGTPPEYRLMVRDGNIIDLLGEKDMPSPGIVGPYDMLDISTFEGVE